MIRLRHMEKRFGGIAVQKREWMCTQYGVHTSHFANTGGPNGRLCQPRPWYVEAEGKFIVESELVNLFAGRRVWRKFPTTQAHAVMLFHGK